MEKRHYVWASFLSWFLVQLTFVNKVAKVSSTAALTLELNRSPRMRMSGPVMCTTDGWMAAADVRRMISPSISAAFSLSSGRPLRMDSRNRGRIGARPWVKSKLD